MLPGDEIHIIIWNWAEMHLVCSPSEIIRGPLRIQKNMAGSDSDLFEPAPGVVQAGHSRKVPAQTT